MCLTVRLLRLAPTVPLPGSPGKRDGDTGGLRPASRATAARCHRATMTTAADTRTVAARSPLPRSCSRLLTATFGHTQVPPLPSLSADPLDFRQYLLTAVQPDVCVHIAVVASSVDQIAPLLTTYYRLGIDRNGWVAHGARPGKGEADRTALTTPDLDVRSLERADRMRVSELDLSLSPRDWIAPWSDELESRLSQGYDAMWFGRFPVNPDELPGVLPFEHEWSARFKGRRTMCLCPYIDRSPGHRRYTAFREGVVATHDHVLELE